MTLTLELPPEVEQELQARARAKGQALPDFALEVLAREATTKLEACDRVAKRRAAIARLQGIMAGTARSSDDLLRERREEAEREMAATAARRPAEVARDDDRQDAGART